MEELNLTNVKVGDSVIWNDGVNYDCYYIVAINKEKKELTLHPYEVNADMEKKGGMGHQNWVFFKTRKEQNEYLKKYGKGTDEELIEPKNVLWKIRYNHWYFKRTDRFTKKEEWIRVLSDSLKWCGGVHFSDKPYYYYNWEF